MFFTNPTEKPKSHLKIKINCNKIIFLLLGIFTTHSSGRDIADHISNQDIHWKNINCDFFNGAFIGDGIQGAMIMQDTINKNDIRMLMCHYKAVSHHNKKNVDNINTMVFAGNIIIHPVGKSSKQIMRLNIWDGEVSGTIITDNGFLVWNAFVERKNNVIVVVIKGRGGEGNASLYMREEWGVTPSIYKTKKNPGDYQSRLPPKPQKSTEGPIDLLINKISSIGAHVVASRLINGSDKSQILYVAIGTDANSNVDSAVTVAKNDAISRVNTAVNEGIVSITTRHKEWWHDYMQNSFLEIKEDSYWQKFWWLQLYKFASVSSETSDLLFDTQGPWIWNCGSTGIWWNLNVQLSYFLMRSSNQLATEKLIIKGMDRINKSGILRKDTGSGPGMTVKRSANYEDSNGWGNEFVNISWILHCYWKYWKYSGNDTIGKALFPMLKDNVAFLMSKLESGSDGKYHMKPFRSPEYTEKLYADVNYVIMSAKWILETLISMNTELGFNDSQRSSWMEKLDKLTPYQTVQNGLRINSKQAFDKEHRNYSHLLGIYPSYNTLTPEQVKNIKDLISRSVNRGYCFSGGAADYIFTGDCAMYAALGDGEKAIKTFDMLKSKIKPNTMYFEGGGSVIKTPLSGVESINYMLLQSWGDLIRVFPAVPSRWKNVNFQKFRTEGAFLVSASMSNGVIDNNITIISEKGKMCSIENPWKGKKLYVFDIENKPVKTSKTSEIYKFSTHTGGKYTISNSLLVNKNNNKEQPGSKCEYDLNVYESKILFKTESTGDYSIKVINSEGRVMLKCINKSKKLIVINMNGCSFKSRQDFNLEFATR